MELLTAARPYARALSEIANENESDAWLPLMELCQLLSDDKNATRFLASQNITSEQLQNFIDGISKKVGLKKSPEQFEKFIKVLVKNNRSVLLPNIATLFIKEQSKKNQTILATIVSAMEISEQGKAMLVAGLERRFNKKVDTSIEIDPTLIGGAIIKVGDTVIDGSVKGRIDQLSKALIH